MTKEEAIEWIECLETTDKEQEMAKRMAIEALKKRKMGKKINRSGSDCQCSLCYQWIDVLDRYCWWCGAKVGRR